MLQRSRGQRRRRVRLWAGVGTSAAEPLWRGAHKAATSLPRSLATIAESPADRVRLEAEVPKTSAPRGRRFDKFQRVSDLRRPVTVSGWRFETVYARRIVPRTNKRLIYAGNWRRRPDLNRGWRFCRFSGVGHRVASCWSLVSPAPPFCLVFGPYWTTFGLQAPSDGPRGRIP